MAIEINSEDAARIRKLVPLATLPGPLFNELCSEATVEEIKDASLFKRGDTDNLLYYLLDGEVALQAEGLVIDVISSAHETSRFALAHQLPRKIDAVAKGVVRFVRFDAERITKPLVREYKVERAEMVVEEDIFQDSEDWMTGLIKLPLLQRLPPANLQKVLFALEEVSVSRDQTIIEQGAPGDYFYFLKSGQCAVSRRPSPTAKDVRLGVLEKGEVFGEDALITDQPRTVSVTALTNATLLRLNKKQFNTLIKTPLLSFVNQDELLALQKKGAVVLDIRPPDEFDKFHLDGAVNMPFFSLRMQLKNLGRETTHIVVCRDGRCSEAGAFFLLKNRFKAVILKGGMVALMSVEASAPAVDAGLENAVSASAQEGGLEQRVEKLTAENETLRQAVKQLNEKYNKLDLEKKQIEDRFAILSKHFEQLKQMLNKLKKNV